MKGNGEREREIYQKEGGGGEGGGGGWRKSGVGNCCINKWLSGTA